MSSGDEAGALWSTRIVGTTWLTRGSAYWTRRALFWLMWIVAGAIVTAMAIGVDIGLARHAGPAGKITIFVVSGAANLGVLILTLYKLWPTAKRARDWAFNDRHTPGRSHAAARTGRGTGAAIGVAAIGSGPLAALVVAPVVVLGAAGLLVAMLVLSSLPQLPEEAIMRCRREILGQRYSRGETTRR